MSESGNVVNESIASADFCQALKRMGSDFFTGVPCSVFTPLYRELARQPSLPYYPALREDSAVGMAVGAYLGGRKPVVIMQNSGLGYSLNAFTSLVLIYQIPILVLISWRGYLGKDAPEHIIMGAKMLDLLRAVEIPFVILGEGDWHLELGKAGAEITETGKPVFLVVRNGVLA